MSSLHDGMLLSRANAEPIEDFFVFGERSCGTNVMQEVIERAFALKRNWSYGWKHGRPTFMAGSKRTLFIVTLRNPFDWAVSMYAKPYHATPEMAALPFARFITQPWQSVMDAPKPHRLDPERYRGQVLIPDRHPLTGAPFRDIFQMRSVKHQAWLGLVQMGLNVAIVQSEVFNDDRARCIAQLTETFNLTPVKDADLHPPYIFAKRPKVDARRAAAKAALEDALPAIHAQLDLQLEERCGYVL